MASSSAQVNTLSFLNEINLEKRLLNVTNTQESIQTLSLWCLHHKAHHAKIVEIWTKVFKTANVNHRLALFYLANDVIQNSKRKGFLHFGEAWVPSIKETIPMVSEEKIKTQMKRILTIWEERSVYEEQFISELRAMFVNGNPDLSDGKLLGDFKPQKLAEKIKKFKKLEADIELKHKQFVSLKLDVCSTETLKQLKDKAHGTKFTKEFEDATTKLDEFVQILQHRVKERKALIEILEESGEFYDTQRKEAKIVANAYKNFGSRVKNLHAKLEEMLPDLSSPVPSPSYDAPSPVGSSFGGSPNIIGCNDNTEAIDMEMSDDDINVYSISQDKDEVSSLSSAPSPDGSPVGLSLSPAQSFFPLSAKTLKPQPKVTSILENIRMTAVAIGTGNATPCSLQKATASSLDIRLSNLMHNIPNFATTLFGGHIPIEPIKVPVSAVPTSQDGFTVPLKDESCAGSITPLQDENHEMRLNSNISSEPQSTDIGHLNSLMSTAAPGNPKNGSNMREPKINSNVHDGILVDNVMPLDISPSFCESVPAAILGSIEAKPLLDSSSLIKFEHRFLAATEDNGDIDKNKVSIQRLKILPSGDSPYFKSNIVHLTSSPLVSPNFQNKLEQQSSWVIKNQDLPMQKNKKCPHLPKSIVSSPNTSGSVPSINPISDGVFFPLKLKPPKKSTITINLRNMKMQSTSAIKNEFQNEFALGPASVKPSDPSNLRTIVTLKNNNSSDNESSEDVNSKNKPPVYSKIETLGSSRDSCDIWTQMVGAGPTLQPTIMWNLGTKQGMSGHHEQPQMEYPRQPHHLFLQPQQRHLRPFDSRQSFCSSWQAGIHNPHWRSPTGPVPKRPLLMPNVPPAQWTYYH